MKKIRCICLDVDGVLTDGLVYVDADGRPARAFNIQDGLAIRWFQRLGGAIVVVTGKTSGSVEHRARELEIEHVIQGSEDKLRDLRAVLDGPLGGVDLAETAAIGDDLLDLPVLSNCGLPIAVANAVDEVKQAARYVTARAGGHGAVREAIEYIMRANGQWRQVVEHFERQAGRAAGPVAAARTAGRGAIRERKQVVRRKALAARERRS